MFISKPGSSSVDVTETVGKRYTWQSMRRKKICVIGQVRNRESPELVRSLAPLSPFRAKEGVWPSHKRLASHCVTLWGVRLRHMVHALRPRRSEPAMKFWLWLPTLLLPTLAFLCMLIGLMLRTFSSFGWLVMSDPWPMLYGWWRPDLSLV